MDPIEAPQMRIPPPRGAARAASLPATRPPGRPPGSPGGPGRPPGNTRFREEEQEIFLEEYRRTRNMTASALKAGVSWAAVNNHRRRDPGFAEAMAEAEAYYRETLLAEAHRRAVTGVVEEKFNAKGEPVGTVTRFSDRLLELLLKRFYPGFRETDVRRIEGEVKHTNVLDLDEIRKMPAERRAALRSLLSAPTPITIDADSAGAVGATATTATPESAPGRDDA